MNELEYNKEFPIAVYVHLGPSIPTHLKLNIERHREIFPTQEITLIVDQEVEFGEFKNIDIFKVDSESLESELFAQMSKYLNFEFRNGFWKYTLQRFFALNLYHSFVSDKALLHIESDVLVMPDFPWQEFLKLGTLAWLKVNDEVDVAALVFSPKFTDTDFLISKLRIYASKNPKINDMEALQMFASEFPDRHYYLPSRTHTCSRSGKELSNSESKALSRFGGVFDPLAFGLWYFGQDPKNSFGLSKRYVDDESHFVSPADAGLSLVGNSLKLTDETKVFSLHLHNKKLSLFGMSWKSNLYRGLNQAQFRSNALGFEWKAFYRSLQGRSFKGNVWLILGSTPFLRKLRKIRLLESVKDSLKRLINP